MFLSVMCLYMKYICGFPTTDTPVIMTLRSKHLFEHTRQKCH